MRFRPQTWFLLSVMLFLAGGYMWWRADEWQAQKAVAPAKQPAAKTPSTSFVLKSKSSLLANLASQSGQTNAPVTNAASIRAERLRHRLSNTTKTVGQLARDDNAILLENALIDTAQLLPAIPDSLRAQEDPGAYIVQACGPVDAAFRALLGKLDAKIISYIPNNAYLVTLSATGAARLRAQGCVKVLAYEPYYKLKSELLGWAVDKKPLPDDGALNVLLFADSEVATREQLKQMGAEVVGEDRSPFGPILRVRPSKNNWVAVAVLRGVQEVELLRRRAPANDLTRVQLGVTTDTLSTTSNYLGLTGANVTVAVNDTGVDAGHLDLTPRVIGDALQDADGHGTHVAGIIASSGGQSVTVSNASGSVPGANFRGEAPAARILSLGIDFDLPFVADAGLQESAAKTNALISNNSWGFINDNSYNILSASYDAATRDSLPTTNGSQPVLYIFSAGNNGIGDDNGLGGGPDTISAPATAKNVIAVGASELLRNITNEVELHIAGVDATNNPITITNIFKPFLGQTDSTNQVAFFSSRGNVGIGVEGDFGRFKPDVVAPGTFVVSTRSRQWDTNAYYNPTNYFFGVVLGVELEPGSRFDDFFFVPANGVSVGILLTNFFSTNNPVPPLPIFARAGQTPSLITDRRDNGNNQVILNFPPDNNEFWFYTVTNGYATNVTFDILLQLAVTSGDNFLQVISNLNNGLGPHYRYESGTSMATPAVSGVAALIADFFSNRVQSAVSPAMLKALLINGARSVNEDIYDFQVGAGINYQGWGKVSLPNAIPPAFSNSPALLTNINVGVASPLKIFEQSPATALATGQSITRTIALTNSAARSRPLRVTLVWTDPPGNPVAGVKLVNDLDLVVTNRDTGFVYLGNDIIANRTFNLPWDTNDAPVVDFVNNVENIYIEGTPSQPLGTNYSITVIGRRVNVNAVTAHTNNYVQDYALVISSGNGTVTNAITITANGVVADINSTNVITSPGDVGNFPHVTAVQDGVPLLNQQVGGNTPLLGTNGIAIGTNTMWGTNGLITLGMTNQWHFYVFTNTAAVTNVNVTNVAFLTFLPPTLSVPREGVFEQGISGNATRKEADIDLYVSTNSALTNLDPAVIAAADKSLERGGTETIVYSNSEPNRVYYIGVKSEDHQAATYGFFGTASATPFSQTDSNGNVIVHCTPARVVIPDGTPSLPGAALVFGIVPNSLIVRRVVVTNDTSHELYGDLLGNLSHRGQFAVLNNHTAGDNTYSNHIVYEDNGEGDITGSRSSDGPGNLLNFVGEQAAGQWLFTMVDNAAFQTGVVERLTLLIQPQSTNDTGSHTIQPGGSFLTSVDVPPEATNLTISLALSTPGPIDMLVRRNVRPTPATYDHSVFGIVAPGTNLVIDATSSPPLRSGRYFIRLFNNSGIAQTFTNLVIALGLDINGVGTNEFNSVGNESLTDDAVSYSSISVTNAADNRRIASTEVGLRIDHPRASDLAVTLVSPRGTRVLLVENRGGADTNGFGAGATTNDFSYLVLTEDAAKTQTPIKFAIPPFRATNSLVSTNFSRFDTVSPPGDYAFLTNVDGWSVTTNAVTVHTNPLPVAPATTANHLMLRDGQITRTLATTPGSQYEMSFAYRGVSNLNPIAWWPGDGNAYDIYGGANGFFSNGATASAAGLVRQAFNFDGVDDFVSCGETNTGNFGTNNFAVEFWVKFNTLANEQVMVEKFIETLSPARTGWTITKLTNNFFRFDQGRGSVSTDFGSAPPINTWMHLAVARQSGVVSFYTNGALASTVTASVNLDSTARFKFGHRGNSADTPGSADTRQFYLNGALDEIAMYDRALTASQIQEIYAAGSNGLCGTPTPPSICAPSFVPGVLAGPIVWTNGHSYYLLQTNTWTNSEAIAVKLGGHLVTINDANEDNWVYNTFSGYGGTNIDLWIGLNDAAQEGTHVWASGELATNYTHWSSGEPNNLGNEDFVYIFAPPDGRAGNWNDCSLFYTGAGGLGLRGLAEVPSFTNSGILVSVDGVTNIVAVTNTAWLTKTMAFTASVTNTPLSVKPVTNNSGALLDSFSLRSVGGDAYYFPEESLDKLKGESARGTWKLEVWDKRAGALLPAGNALLGWYVSFVFESIATSVPSPIFESNNGTTNFINEINSSNLPATLTVDNHATPANSSTAAQDLTYTLVNPPSGASIDANGIITWTPTEEQGPGTYVITTIATDAQSPPRSATNSFTVIVSEVNEPPFFVPPTPPDQTVDVGGTLNVTNAASDSDIPANTLTYTLTNNPPAGANIDANGVITWTPTIAQGGTTNIITTVVTDNGGPPLSATNSFTVIVPVSIVAFGVDLRGTGIKYLDGALYLCGNSVAAGGFLASFALPLTGTSTPAWFTNWPSADSRDFLNGITAKTNGVYAAGLNYTRTLDSAGGKETKGLVVKFPLSGATGPGFGGAIWDRQTPAPPGAFAYSGTEGLYAIASTSENGTNFLYTSGFAEPGGGGRLFVSKLAEDSTVLWTMTDGAGPQFSIGQAIAVLNTNIYVAGSFGGNPYLRKYNPSGTLIWTRTSSTNGAYYGIAATDNYIYAVGGAGSGAGEDFLVDKWDESGNQIWSRTHDRSSSQDQFNAAVSFGHRTFAVGFTYGATAGGADAVIAEIDPGTGDLLSTQLFGGALDDLANGVDTDNANLFIIGETRSFAAGTNQAMILQYIPAPPPPILFSSITALPGGFLLRWNYPSYGQFNLQWTTNLVPVIVWNTLTNTFSSTNGSFMFLDDGSQTGGFDPFRFYRLILLP